jgi:NAD(P)-dependent dehydrogenase (short-subunit alcohol dehydrogenase family)
MYLCIHLLVDAAAPFFMSCLQDTEKERVVMLSDKRFDATNGLQGEGVLVTGCSSGIGRVIAIQLALRGFTVFATVRKEADYENLLKLREPNLVPIYPLDLSKPEHLPHVVETVQKELTARGKAGLYALINNAGGGFISPVELMALDRFRTELETRIVGPVALVQAFLPLIRKAQGRILWITTPGLIAIPYVSSIHACEFAMNCIAQSLHLELMRWNIPNIMICCGGIKTAAVEKSARELNEALERWTPEQQTLYSRAIQRLQERLTKFDTNRSEPEAVARIVYRALSTRKPKRRYQVGHGSNTMAMLHFMPQSVIDYVFSKMT